MRNCIIWFLMVQWLAFWSCWTANAQVGSSNPCKGIHLCRDFCSTNALYPTKMSTRIGHFGRKMTRRGISPSLPHTPRLRTCANILCSWLPQGYLKGPLTNKYTHLHIHSFIHSFTHLFIHSFTHLIILAVSLAPLQVLYYSEALPTTARILYRSFTPKRIGNCR